MAANPETAILAGLSCVSTVLTLLSAVDGEKNEEKRRKRSMWTRESLLKRSKLGAYTTVVRELSQSEPDAFHSFLRMSEATFTDLLRRIAPIISKKDTLMRECISAEERLVVTLRFLASGMSYKDLEAYHKIGKSTLSGIIPDTCNAIYQALQEEFLKAPKEEADWLEVAKKFQEKWNFPHCIGAIDGKHVSIQKPPKSGSEFYNYKKFCSIVLLAVVDADYKFLLVDVGANGKVPDATVFQSSGFANALTNNTMNIPEATTIQGIDESVPYYLVGDEAFPLKRYLMKPYPQRNLSLKKRVFNYRCSRARRISENAFGILASKFRIFQRPIQLSVKNAESIVLACLSLHNYLRTKADRCYLPAGTLDTETPLEHNIVDGAWRSTNDDNHFSNLPPQGGNRTTSDAQTMRDKLAEYFCSANGAVPWQWNKVVTGEK